MHSTLPPSFPDGRITARSHLQPSRRSRNYHGSANTSRSIALMRLVLGCENPRFGSGCRSTSAARGQPVNLLHQLKLLSLAACGHDAVALPHLQRGVCVCVCVCLSVFLVVCGWVPIRSRVCLRAASTHLTERVFVPFASARQSRDQVVGPGSQNSERASREEETMLQGQAPNKRNQSPFQLSSQPHVYFWMLPLRHCSLGCTVLSLWAIALYRLMVFNAECPPKYRTCLRLLPRHCHEGPPRHLSPFASKGPCLCPYRTTMSLMTGLAVAPWTKKTMMGRAGSKVQAQVEEVP